MSRRLDWTTDGADWPNRAASRFVTASGFAWHVQIMGSGPVLLLLHGTGASTHSWRDLMPLLAAHFTVVAPDLPSHGFTDLPERRQMSLPGMAHAVCSLLVALDIVPEIVVGHSAGAAIATRMVLDGVLTPKLLVCLNGALLPLASMPSELFSPLARVMAALPFMPRIAAWQAGSQGSVERLLEGTGSTVDARGVALYRRLVSNPGHVAGALEMMACWNLRDLPRELPKLAVPLLLIVGANDRTIPSDDALRIQRMLPSARVVTLSGLGHLAHEEAPVEHARLIIEATA